VANEVQRPYGRGEYGRALLINAATEPFNALILAGMLIAGIAIGQLGLLAPLAVLVYAVAIARTVFDKDEQDKVLARARARRRSTITGAPRIDAAALAPPIAVRIDTAREREARIREAIERAELPYDEVSAEVDGFVRAMEGTATRAQLLYEALNETPINEVEGRLHELAAADDPARYPLREALQKQLTVLRRMEAQLQRFYDEMDRMTVELDTIRGNLVSLSASTEAASQRRLADELRGLRDEMGTLAEGIDEAYKD